MTTNSPNAMRLLVKRQANVFSKVAASHKNGSAYNELTTSEMVTDRITKPVKLCMFYCISIFGIYLHTLYQLAVAMSANVLQAFWLLGRFERSA